MPEERSINLPRSSSHRSAYEIARFAALEAGSILKNRFGRQNSIQVKGRRNLVTEADLMSEKRIIEILRKEFPRHGILSEEAGASKSDCEYSWIIDPLDGTNNYHFGVPFFCVNIALSLNGEVILGLTYDPMRREMFHAAKGKGVYLNRRRTAVSDVEQLEQAAVGLDLGYVPERSVEMLDLAARIWAQTHCIRLMGSSCLGLAYVASGRLSIYFHKYLYPWDLASGLLLVSEGGGEIINFDGTLATTADRAVIASNKQLLDEFKRWLEMP
ncbi:MAG: inositol monophosphatase [Dehalococcoidia bacterium]|nr:inositol monophosphatase [Dehalococcoidia bacterium]